MSRPGEFQAPGGLRREVRSLPYPEKETQKIEGTCRHCGSYTREIPWVTECYECQYRGRTVRGLMIVDR